MSNFYNTNKTNCNRCGTVIAYGWVLTCPACVTNQRLEEQNRLISNASPGRSSISSSPGTGPIGSVIIGALITWITIGFLFFPHWGIVSFAKFLWTVFVVLLAGVLAIPYALFQLLF